MSPCKKALNILACLIFLIACVRAVAFWAADPMLAYANNYDQIRVLRLFGLQPADSGRDLYAATPDQPYRHFIQADEWHKPQYPSSDLLPKAIQYLTMKAFPDEQGRLNIRMGTFPILASWLILMASLFSRTLQSPIAALGLASWLAICTDPINFLFLNTWYAEFSAFYAFTLLIGIIWLWTFDCMRTRTALLLGSLCLAFISLNRNQFMYLLPAVAAVVAIPHARRPWPLSKTTCIALAMLCVTPVLVFHSKVGQLASTNAANRIDTVFGALLPAASDPAHMLKTLKLPDTCLRFSGKNWYDTPTTDYQTHCPQAMKLSLTRIGVAALQDPAAVAHIIHTITIRHRGFTQGHLGQREGTAYSRLDQQAAWSGWSFERLIRGLPSSTAHGLLWLLMVGPAVAWLVALLRHNGRWAVTFALCFTIFNYVVASSIFGDGYFDLERHAVLCFTMGSAFLTLFLAFVAESLKAHYNHDLSSPG